MGDQDIVLIFRLLAPLLDSEALALNTYCINQGFIAYIQEGGPDSVRPLFGSPVRLHYSLPDEALTFEFLPTDFTQVNTEINRKMVAQAMEWLSPQSHEQILDLFCGIGNFTLPLAKRCQHVVGIEGNTDLVERAKKNAQTNALQNTEFHVANLYEPVADFTWMKKRYDAILLDPPRSGAAEMMPLLGKLGAKRVLYVSCYPGTLARDAGMLVNEHGFRLVMTGVMDMFPHTAHVESMALFEKK
jgi:23S rRNA (uracil1939-C5)-methyltransferase